MKKTLILAVLGLFLLARAPLRLRRAAPLSAEQFVAGLPVLQPGLRLEVARLDLVKTAAGESPKSVLGVDLGTTKAVVSVPARVHYALDLSGTRPVGFSDDGAVLTAVFPDPEVSAVELFLGAKRTLVQPGWGRLATLSGAELSETLERGLQESLRREAATARMLGDVREKARPELARLVARYARRPPARVRVRFRSEEGWGQTLALR